MAQHDIKINLPGLLKMLGSNIYAEPDVAVREMIQNAHDTCIIRTTKDAAFTTPRIEVSFDKARQTLTFSDNGAGMTEDELHKYLSTIGEGFTKFQKEQLRGAGAQAALLLIGQFGIGLLSAFSIADTVEVFTKSHLPQSSGFEWECGGDIHYTVDPIPKADIGTRVVLHVTDSNLALLDDTRLRQAIKKYADFLSVPIYLNGNQINSCTPPWLCSPSEAEGRSSTSLGNQYADYIKARYDLYPIAVLPFALDDPLPLDGLLFAPLIPFELTRDFGEVDIYVSRMFIKANDKELLPPWARFIKGVINTPALLPTVSRNELVRDEHYATIRAMLGELILQYLAFLEEKNPETLQMVVGAYNNTIKARSVEDDDFFDRVCDLVKVSTDSGYMSMSEYLAKSNGVIYYFAERGTATQHKLLFAHKGLPVIDASWGMEEEFLEKYAARHDGVTLERLEAGSGVIFKVLETPDEKWQDLERQFQLLLKREAKAVSFEPPTVPAVLVAKPIDRADKDLEPIAALGAQIGISSGQLRQMFGKMAQRKIERAAGGDMLLQLNVANPLMQQLRDMHRNETFRLAITAIYNNAMMFAHHYVSPENAEIIFSTNNAAISAMIGNSRALDEVQDAAAKLEIELNDVKRKLPQIKLSEHRSCFFAYPVEQEFHALRNFIAQVLMKEYGIKLLDPAIELRGANMIEGIKCQIAESHFGIADITRNDPKVLWQLGMMIGASKQVIILRKQNDQIQTPFDEYGEHRLVYQRADDSDTGAVAYPFFDDKLKRQIRRIFELCPELKQAQQWKGSQPVDMGYAPPFPQELHRQIVQMLTGLPNLHDRSAQRALIYSAGFDSELADRIAVGDAPSHFVELLVNTVSTYGRLTDGRPALAAILDAAKGQVGIDKQAACNELIQKLQTLTTA